MARFCVFTGSSPGDQPAYLEAAQGLGKALALRGHGLVYGGAKVGLMRAVADGVLAGGGEVTGVLPHFMASRELAHPELTTLIGVETMHERKARMAELADGFIALPGGYGTLDELFEILTWAQLGLHAKPVALLNPLGFFDGLLAYLNHATASGFVRSSHRDLLRVHTDPIELLKDLETFPSGPVQTKWI
jgi:uncharacterized protein (TIGR00730 family)